MNASFPRIILACVGVALCAACYMFSPSRQGKKINEVWETENNTFKIRVTAYAEQNGGYVGGAYYFFESSPLGSNNWRAITTFRHDDPMPIPRGQIRFVNDQVGYVFMVWMYAVTTDGGMSWSTWNAFKDMPQWKDHPSIKDVSLGSDGTGKMSFNSSSTENVQELHTKDYGRHWGM